MARFLNWMVEPDSMVSFAPAPSSSGRILGRDGGTPAPIFDPVTQQLRRLYSDVEQEPIPEPILALLRRLRH
jgi:hypothetical protein